MQQLGDYALWILLLAGYGLLPKFLTSKIEHAARGQVDESVGKALAEYNHTLELQLEGHRARLTEELESVRQSLALDRERYARDYGLFAERRNAVYAETFGALQKAIGGYASHFAGLTEYRDYTSSPEADLRAVAGRLELITAGERDLLNAALASGDRDEAGRLATTLHERDRLRQSQVMFRDFKRMWVIDALYFSADVDDLLRQAVHSLAKLNYDTDELIYSRQPNREASAKALHEVEAVNAKIRTAMRGEMQAGFSLEDAKLSGGIDGGIAKVGEEGTKPD